MPGLLSTHKNCTQQSEDRTSSSSPRPRTNSRGLRSTNIKPRPASEEPWTETHSDRANTQQTKLEQAWREQAETKHTTEQAENKRMKQGLSELSKDRENSGKRTKIKLASSRHGSMVNREGINKHAAASGGHTKTHTHTGAECTRHAWQQQRPSIADTPD